MSEIISKVGGDISINEEVIYTDSTTNNKVTVMSMSNLRLVTIPDILVTNLLNTVLIYLSSNDIRPKNSKPYVMGIVSNNNNTKFYNAVLIPTPTGFALYWFLNDFTPQFICEVTENRVTRDTISTTCGNNAHCYFTPYLITT